VDILRVKAGTRTVAGFTLEVFLDAAPGGGEDSTVTLDIIVVGHDQ